MENELRQHIEKLISDNEIILFMKGTPDAPACGFSARAASVLNSFGKRYAAVDILPDSRIREELSAVSNWPTIPQLFVGGELVGGSDIVMEMYESGELAELIGVEPAADAEPQTATPQPQSQGLQLENRLD